MAKKVLTYSIKTILNRSFPELPFDGPWKHLIGKPSPNFRAIVHGAPKQGKSTFALMLAKKLGEYGKVLYSVSETGISKSLKSAIQRTGLDSENEKVRFSYIQNAKDLEDKVKSRAGYRFIFVDSGQSCGLGVGEFVKLYKAYPHKSFIIVLQSKRNGDFHGPQRWVHEVDCKIMLEAGVAYCEGRFAPEGSMVVLPGKSKGTNQMQLFT